MARGTQIKYMFYASPPFPCGSARIFSFLIILFENSKFRIAQSINLLDICAAKSTHYLKMKIENSTAKDIPEIFRLYKIASEYQTKIKAVVIWPEFERGLVETEIAENRQWKLIIDGQTACVWATTFTDEQIWEERNVDAAVYIHRIATNPNFRGQNFVAIIVKWAKEFAKNAGKDFVRLDTIGNNTKLIEHYTGAGFQFLGLFDLKNTDGLPAHYHNAPACLFEIKL